MITAENVVSTARDGWLAISHNANYGTKTMTCEHERVSEAHRKSRAQGSGGTAGRWRLPKM